MIHIGAHVSVAKGWEAMGKTTLELGGDTFAFFLRSPRGGAAKPVVPEDAAALRAIIEEHGFGTIVAHAPYTMNLCAVKEYVVEHAEDVFRGDLQNLEDYLPGQYMNFHPGSHVGQGAEVAIPRIADALNRLMDPGQTTTILLETMAGKGSEVGRTFEELRDILDLVKPDLQDRMGVCLDTCHVWDAGYDLSDLDAVLDEFDKVLGLHRLKAIHLNDSKNPCGAPPAGPARTAMRNWGRAASEKSDSERSSRTRTFRGCPSSWRRPMSFRATKQRSKPSKAGSCESAFLHRFFLSYCLLSNDCVTIYVE